MSFRGWRIALFPYRHFERSREIFLAHRISQLVSLAVGSILLISRHQTPSVFLSARGDPSAALGMTVRGSSLSVSLGTFDPSASRILIKEVRVCAHHLIEERQYPWSLIPNPCFQISGFGHNGYNEPLSRSMSHHQCRRILANAV